MGSNEYNYDSLQEFLTDLLVAKRRSNDIPQNEKDILGRIHHYIEEAVTAFKSTYEGETNKTNTKFYVFLLWTMASCANAGTLLSILGDNTEEEDIENNFDRIKKELSGSGEVIEKHLGAGLRWWIKENIKA